MANDPTGFTDTDAVTPRALELPAADWTDGVNGGGGNTSGIGIATNNPNLEQQLPNWTLLDQNGNPRTPQIGQSIGNGLNTGTAVAGTSPILVTEPADNTGDGSFTSLGDATLATLAAGWTAGVVSGNLVSYGGDTITYAGDSVTYG